MHTIYSDGIRHPNDLIDLAIDNNIDIISITDHDSIMGLKNISNKNKNIKIVNGIELTSYYNNESIHILGYNIDINNKELNDKLDSIRTNKFYAIIASLAVLKDKYNIEFSSYDLANLFNNPGSISRVDIAKLCLKYNYVTTISEAFDKYLANIYDYININNIKIEPKEVINLIHKSGGFAILAHPKIYKIDNIEDFIKELIFYGLDGIEVYHSLHNKEDIKYYLKLANKYNLKISGGSDYHGESIKEKIPISYAKENEFSIDKLTILESVDYE